MRMPGTIRCRELCLSDFGIHKVCYHGGITYDATKGKQQTNTNAKAYHQRTSRGMKIT